KPRINLQQRLAALKSIIDPFGAGVKIGRRSGNDWCRRKNRRDVVEDWVRPFCQPIGLAFHQRLIRVPKRVLECVEQLRQLEAKKFFGIEVSDALAALERAQLSSGQLPQLMQLDVR